MSHVLHMMRVWCVACNLHMTALWPLESRCWRQLAMQPGDWKNSRIAPFNVITFTITIIVTCMAAAAAAGVIRQGQHCWKLARKPQLCQQGHSSPHSIGLITNLLLSPARILGLPDWWDFCICDCFVTMQVVTLQLRVWCMMDLFLKLALA